MTFFDEIQSFACESARENPGAFWRCSFCCVSYTTVWAAIVYLFFGKFRAELFNASVCVSSNSCNCDTDVSILWIDFLFVIMNIFLAISLYVIHSCCSSAKYFVNGTVQWCTHEIHKWHSADWWVYKSYKSGCTSPLTLGANSVAGTRLYSAHTLITLYYNSEVWQVTYLPRPPTLCYPHQSCTVGWGRGRSQPCQVSSKSVQGFWLPEGSKSAIFLWLALWLIWQVRATVEPVIAYH